MCEFWFLIPRKTCTAPQISPVFTVLLLEPFLEPQMYMNSVFLIFLLVSLVVRDLILTSLKDLEEGKVLVFLHQNQIKVQHMSLNKSNGFRPRLFNVDGLPNGFGIEDFRIKFRNLSRPVLT